MTAAGVEYVSGGAGEVYDEQHKRASEAHGWIECHPVFAVKDVTPKGVPREPSAPGLAPPTEERPAGRDG